MNNLVNKVRAGVTTVLDYLNTEEGTAFTLLAGYVAFALFWVVMLVFTVASYGFVVLLPGAISAVAVYFLVFDVNRSIELVQHLRANKEKSNERV